MCHVKCFLQSPPACPSSRYTVYNLLSYMEKYSVKVDVHSFYSPNAYEEIRQGPKTIKKIFLIFMAYLRLAKEINTARQSDIVWIHRFAAPIGTGLIASILKFFGKPLVFGFDDAVFLNQQKGNYIRDWFGSWRSIKKLVTMSDYVFARNHSLGDYAQSKNPNVLVLPSAIDTALYAKKVSHNRKIQSNKRSLILGWIGTPFSAPYIELVRSVIERLGREGPIELRLIGGDIPDIEGVTVRRIRWQQATEIDELCKADVGIATLPNDEWARGKSGLKVVQYMGCGLPVVASAVGSHLDLFESGKQGFLVHTETDWLNALRTLRDNEKLRTKMGKAGQQKAQIEYDFAIIAKKTAEIFIELYQNIKQ